MADHETENELTGRTNALGDMSGGMNVQGSEINIDTVGVLVLGAVCIMLIVALMRMFDAYRAHLKETDTP